MLGALGLFDQGEVDWKIICISVESPLASRYARLDDVPSYVLDGIQNWFRWYKTPSFKKDANGNAKTEGNWRDKVNDFSSPAYIGHIHAMQVIGEAHLAFQNESVGKDVLKNMYGAVEKLTDGVHQCSVNWRI